MVFAGIYPIDPGDFDDLKRSIEKLQLQDASIKVDYEVSAALGSGFRVGFLGLLHLVLISSLFYIIGCISTKIRR